MKKLLMFSLSLVIIPTLFGMKDEEAIINKMEKLTIIDVSIDQVLENKDLKKFVANLEIECEDQNGHTLLELAVTKYINLDQEIDSIKNRLNNYFSNEDEEIIIESFEYQQKLSNSFLDKKLLLLQCFTLMKLLLEANAKIYSVGSNKTKLYRKVLASPFASKEITELFVCEKEKRVKNKKLKKELLKKEQENK